MCGFSSVERRNLLDLLFFFLRVHRKSKLRRAQPLRDTEGIIGKTQESSQAQQQSHIHTDPSRPPETPHTESAPCDAVLWKRG